MAKIVIIGAGPTGLSAAYHLEKKGFFDYKLFEKESETGGLCRSMYQDGFTFDYTGHLLHVGDPYFKQFIHDVVGFENLASIKRRSFVYSHDVFTGYPWQVNLYGLPVDVIADCIEGFITRPKTRKKPRTFPDWVMQSFGAGFAKHFFLPYQRKIFAHNLNQITTSWTGRFVPTTSLQQIINGAIKKSDDELIGYNAQFYYPKTGGTAFWVNKLAEQLTAPIQTNSMVSQIDVAQKMVTFANGHSEPYDHLITTMPLDRLLSVLVEPSTSSLKRAIPKLVCNQVVNFNLGIARANLSDKHWIYYPEPQYPFYRMGFYHNFAASMAPEGHSSVYGEFSHINAPKKKVAEMLATSLAATKKILGIEDREIVTQKIVHISHAYVIYDFWREKNLAKIHEQLQSFGIHSIGRYGEWKYSSMQEAILDGKKTVEKLVIESANEAFYVPNDLINRSTHPRAS